MKSSSHSWNKAVALITFALVLAGSSAWAQLPQMQKLFLEAPQEIIPTLGDVERTKIIEAFNQGSEYNAEVHPINNVLGGRVTLHQLTEDYIKLDLDSLTELQMKVLPYKKRKNYVVALVATSKVTPAQSVIAFFDKQWKKVDAPQLFNPFESRDFFENPKDFEQREVKKALVELGRLSYIIELSPQSPELTVRTTTFDDLSSSPKSFSDPTPLLKKPGIVMEWNKKKGFAKK